MLVPTTKKKLLMVAMVAAIACLASAVPALAAEASPSSQLAPASVTAAKASLATAEVSTSKAAYKYTGKAVKPKPTVIVAGTKLKPSRDYTVSYKSNKEVGTAKLTVSGKGAYAGTKTVKFEIAYSMSAVKAAKIKAFTYTGKTIEPKPTLTYKGKTLSKNNYSVSYSGNVDAGRATVIVKGRDQFTGKKKLCFTITKASLAKAKVSAIAAQKYTGSPATPVPKVKLGKVTLEPGRDYKLSYSNNTGFGTANVTVKGVGNYSGKATAKFTIEQPAVERQNWILVNHGAACFLKCDPETIYVATAHPPEVTFPKALRVWNGKYTTSTNKKTGKVTKMKQYTLVRSAYAVDHSKYNAVTIPAGLARQMYDSAGVEFKSQPINYEALWISIFDDARTPTGVTVAYKRLGVDVPEWFSKAVYDAAASNGSNYLAHLQQCWDYVLL